LVWMVVKTKVIGHQKVRNRQYVMRGGALALRIEL
jgi:hypothetical protein